MSLLTNYFHEKCGMEAVELEDKGVLVYRLDKDHVHVEILYVHPLHRRDGIGTKLAEMLLQKHPDLKGMTAAVQTNHMDPTSSLLAILSFGFEIVGSNNHEIHLYKDLTNGKK